MPVHQCNHRVEATRRSHSIELVLRIGVGGVDLVELLHVEGLGLVVILGLLLVVGLVRVQPGDVVLEVLVVGLVRVGGGPVVITCFVHVVGILSLLAPSLLVPTLHSRVLP